MTTYKKITRSVSLLDDSSKLEHLHTFSRMPASMACTNEGAEDDIFMDQQWDICCNTGLIQLRHLFPLELVYKFPHNDGIGKVWENHDKALCSFIESIGAKTILEIGSGTGRLGNLFTSKRDTNHWTGLEPNHSYKTIAGPNFTHLREWFNESYVIKTHYDAIVHSHVFEHTYDPRKFLKTIHKQIGNKTIHIFSVPNLFKSFKNMFTNQLNFEHTVFITEDILDILLKQVGFKIIKKQYHKELSSIFYACIKTKPEKINKGRTKPKNNIQIIEKIKKIIARKKKFSFLYLKIISLFDLIKS